MEAIFSWATFLMLALAATLSPGPAVMLAIRNGFQVGFRRSLVAIIGNVLAMLTYAFFATIGVVVLFKNFTLLIAIMQIIGGAYLVFLGFRFYTVFIGVDNIISKNCPDEYGSVKLFVEAYLVGLSNPKALLFYSSLFPQFINSNSSVVIQSSILALTFAACSFSALCMYSYISSRIFNRFGSHGLFIVLNKMSGVVFVIFGSVLTCKAFRNLLV